MKYFIFLTAATCAAFAGAASAADFTGPRIEVHAGYDRIGLDDDELGLEGHGSGVVYGIGAGFDVAVTPSLIAGIEFSGDLSSAKQCFEFDEDFDEICVKARRTIEAGARVGGKVSDNAMIYFKAGYANGRIKVTSDEIEEILDEDELVGNADGVYAGFGLEYAVGAKSYVKVEYKYTSFEGDFDRSQVIAGVGLRF